ncbi:flagellar basal body rod protein FlgB [Clostridium sp. Cult2]|uniref:flagellar basal body rod protein FlgB n=1 Tax=Clostridium sp. Cult2 TaxID=2079003 RepID=UPI001F0062D4|nr:flagellar basal body rod protein FlgB [Clostridium sp. Cult2]MCF6466320.1 flagellar basal body rod protein FlgB [Clostridium sp. Cult2]
MFNRLYSNINIFNKALDGFWLRDKAINNNISNANTPNYKRLTVNFEDQLKEALKNQKTNLNRTHSNHLPYTKRIDEIEPSISVDKKYSYRFDNNNVNIDTEMADLAKNTIMYNALINQVIDEFDKIKNVINEGSK